MALSGNDTVRIVPLGGLGEIGLNLMVIEHERGTIIIDAGVMFSEERALGVGRLLPDLRYLKESKQPVSAIFLTHAHEDHLGALPYLLEKFPAPVYGTEVTLAFARRSLAEAVGIDPDLRTMIPGVTIEAGPFTVEAVRVTHSTPDSVALAIRTPAGIIVHSGDFKIDPSPVDGVLFDSERFAQLGDEGVELLLSDSTNSERNGHCDSESSLKPILSDLIRRTPGKFFLSAFSSHLHRIRQVAEAAHEAGRYVVPLGRRMAESVRLGMETGQLNLPIGTFIGTAEAEFIEPRRLVLLATGSQGEPSSALTKLAADTHPVVHVGHNDMVVLSSRSIPGNERAIHTVINQLFKRGAEVLYDGVAPVHVSGHACRDELIALIKLVRPRYFVPIHGEYRHLVHHMRLATAAGIAPQNCFLLEDGDPIVIANGGVRRARSVHVGRLIEEGDRLTGLTAISERRALAHEGTVIAIVVLSAADGRIVGGPDLIARGVLDRTSLDLDRARAEVSGRLKALNGYVRFDQGRIRDEMTRALRHYFSSANGRRPLIVPYVMEV